MAGFGDTMVYGVVRAQSYERAKEFYTTLFGWKISTYPGFEDYPMWQAPNQISGGGLAPRSDDLKQPRSYVEVDSIDDTIAKAKGCGGTVVMDKTAIDETSWFAVIRDLDGNDIGLYEGTTGGGEG